MHGVHLKIRHQPVVKKLKYLPSDLTYKNYYFIIITSQEMDL